MFYTKGTLNAAVNGRENPFLTCGVDPVTTWSQAAFFYLQATANISFLPSDISTPGLYLCVMLFHSKVLLSHIDPFTHTFIQCYIHTALSITHHSYTVGTTVRDNLGFSILAKDTSESRMEIPGIEPLTFSLMDDPLPRDTFVHISKRLPHKS